jgi:hypothetical protein
VVKGCPGAAGAWGDRRSGQQAPRLLIGQGPPLGRGSSAWAPSSLALTANPHPPSPAPAPPPLAIAPPHPLLNEQKLVNVKSCEDITVKPYVARELMLVKVGAHHLNLVEGGGPPIVRKASGGGAAPVQAPRARSPHALRPPLAPQVRCTPSQRGELRHLSQIFRMAIIDVVGGVGWGGVGWGGVGWGGVGWGGVGWGGVGGGGGVLMA